MKSSKLRGISVPEWKPDSSRNVLALPQASFGKILCWIYRFESFVTIFLIVVADI